ncbi:MFS transporter [Pelotomaculum propionicicum]|uniref:MFS transporter n=1 Tax=Pelotomaculum propionicicum TaxID=258475 RepID=UPI003B80BB67
MNQDPLIKKYALITVLVASFTTPFMGSAVNLAIPTIGREFDSSALLLSWVVSSYLLSSAAFLLPFGRLADIVGRKKVFILGVLIFSISSLLCGLAWSIQALIGLRLLQGVGSAMTFGTGMAILTSVYPPQERGRVLGFNVATVYTGLSLGPVLGGAMNQHLGWQSIFFLNAVIGLAAFVFATRIKGEWAGARGESFDTTGSVLYMSGLVAFLYAFSSIATSGTAKYILLAGLVLLVLFVWHEMKSKSPLIDLKLFSRNVTFAMSNLAALINYSATFAVTFVLSLVLQVVIGYSSSTAGMILLAQPVMMALLSPFAGTLSDRVQPRIVSSIGMALSALGLFLLSFVVKETPVWLIVGNLMVLGTGFALFSSPNMNAIMGSVDKRFYGVASSTSGTMRLVGQAVSVAVATMIIDLYVGSAQLGPAVADQLQRSSNVAFIVFAVTCVGGVFASLARGNMERGAKQAGK